MMKQILFAFFALALRFSGAFAPSLARGHSKTVLSMAVDMPPPVPVNVMAQHQQLAGSSSSQVNQGIQNYLAASDFSSSSVTLSLKDRPPPPTAEEIAAKKANFNLW